MSSALTFAARVPTSGTSVLLGQQVLDFEPETTKAQVAFTARPDFLNPAGFVQGGILTAMLDDTMGPSIWLATGGELFPVTIEMSVSFLGSATLGVILGEARVIQQGKSIAFLEAQLTDEGGKLIARATASVRLVTPRPPRDATS